MNSRSWRRYVWGAVTLSFVGCASGGADEAAPDAPAPVVGSGGACITGTVLAGGLDISPRTFVQSAEGAPVDLVGELVGNVRLLAGTVVEVCGPGRTDGDELEVTHVALRTVDGMPAALGTLGSDASGWRLDPVGGGEPIYIVSVPPDLSRAEDRVVWVAGPMEDGRLSVGSYAVLEGWR